MPKGIVRDEIRCTAKVKGSGVTPKGERCPHAKEAGYEVCWLHGAGRKGKRPGRPSTSQTQLRVRRQAREFTIYERARHRLEMGDVIGMEERIAQLSEILDDRLKEAVSGKALDAAELRACRELFNDIAKTRERQAKIIASQTLTQHQHALLIMEMGRVLSIIPEPVRSQVVAALERTTMLKPDNPVVLVTGQTYDAALLEGGTEE